MFIISHDRHFLNSVCTQMADIGYGELRIYPVNYEFYLAQSGLLREQLLAGNDKKVAEIAELQDFVNRFGANASKAKQASSRAKKMDKIKLDDVKSSSRITPKIAFSPGKKMHRQALELENLSHGFDGSVLFEKGDLLLEAGAKLAIIGENGVGKTTLLRCLMSELDHLEGVVKWSENASVGYCPQDSGSFFDNDLTLMEWMSQWRRPCHNDLSVRGMLGRMLFTDDDANKKARNCSGGEKNRLLFGMLMMADINVLIMDEPTNHLDIEMREALTMALQTFAGATVLVSHDRHLLKATVDEYWLVEDGKVELFEGDLDDYHKHVQAKQAASGFNAGQLATNPNSADSSGSNEKKAAGSSAQDRKEQKRLDAERRARLAPMRKELKKLETRMEKLQSILDESETQLGDTALYEADRKADLQKILQQQGDAKSEMEEVEMEWMELSEEMEAAE